MERQDLEERIKGYVRDEARPLMLDRLRLGLWGGLGVILLFGLADLHLDPGALLPLYSLKLLGAVGIGAVFFLLRRPLIAARAQSLSLLVLAGAFASTAVFTIMAGQAVTAMMLNSVIAVTAATLLPWGVWPQLLTAAMAAVSTMVSVYVTTGSLGAANGYPAVAACLSWVYSVAIAYQFEQSRLALGRENLQRAEERERFHQLADHLQDIFWLATPDFNEILYVSPSFTTITGRRPEAFFEKPHAIFDLIHPDDRGVLVEALRRIRDGQRAEAEYRVVRPDGSRRWIWAQGFPVRNADGEIYRMAGIWRDVTERKRAEEEKAALLEVAREVTGTLDLDEIIERVQRHAAVLLPCDAVMTFYWDPARRASRMIGHHGIQNEWLADLSRLEFRAGDPIIEHLATNGTVVINGGDGQQLLPPELLARFSVGALAGVPLLVRGRLLGACFAFRFGRDACFEAGQVQLLEGIGHQVALATEAADLYRAQQEDARVSAALASIGQELIASVETPVLLDRLCQLTTMVLGCDFSRTWLWQENEQAYAPVAGYGDAPEQWESARVARFPRGLVAALVERLQHEEVAALDPAAVEDGLLAPAVLAAALGRDAGRCLLVALRRGNDLFGVHLAGYRGRTELFTAYQQRIARGIAQLAPMALETARLVEELESANRVKEHFVATLSHELRNPVAVISGYSELLLDSGRLSDGDSEIVGRIAKNAGELIDLITATLDLSRFTGKRVPLDLQTVRVADVLTELAREIPAPAGRPDVKLTWNVAPELPLLRTDPLKLKMVLRNLVGNALKFTERGHVTASAKAAGAAVELSVSDSGIGIPASGLAHIFEPFHQVHGVTSRQRGGAGLGLYLVRRLTEVLGGTVEVESAEGHGSTFRVRLPADRPAQTA